MSAAARLQGPAIRAFALAGRAILTVVNPATGGHFTFRVRAAERGQGGAASHFVDVLAGPDNTRDYRYVGCLAGGAFRPSRKLSPDAPSVLAFAWFWRHADDPSPAEVLHEGRCGRCGRVLTVPESIESGIGPECEKRLRGISGTEV